jgi:hypothetical protein
LVGLELCEAMNAFWLYSDGLVPLMLSEEGLGIFVSMLLDETFESHWLVLYVFRDGISALRSIHL